MIYVGIGVLVLIGVLIFVSFRFEHQIKALEEHRSWVSEERERLKRIAFSYSNYCKECVDRHFSSHTQEICSSSKYSISPYKIDALYVNQAQLSNEIKRGEEEYINNLAEKYHQLIGNFRADSYPSYMIDEYKTEIRNLANQYEFIAALMREQIKEMQRANSE